MSTQAAGPMSGDETSAPSGLLLSGPIPEWVSTAQQVANVIRDELFSGVIAPGSRLSDEALASTLGVSRNTVREAIQILASEGLVQRTLHRGAVAKDLTAEDLTDLFQARRVVELSALEEARGAGPEWLEALHRCIRKMKDAVASGDDLELLRADLEFHETIVGSLASKRISTFYRLCRGQIRLFRGWQGSRTPPEVTLARLMELVDSLDGGDFDLASARLRALIDGGEERLRKGITEAEDRARPQA